MKDQIRTTDGNGLSRNAFLRLAGASAVVASGLAGAPRRPASAQDQISTRPIPTTNEALPVIGLGTSRTFDIGAGEAERAPRREVLQVLIEGGGSVIDSSPMYGRSEGVVGDLISELGMRKQAFFATKVWTRGRDAGLEQMEASFDLFRSDRIDLMQIHNLVDWRTHLPSLRAWKDEGRFRYTGITHYTVGALDRLAEALREETFDFVQLAYSIDVRDAEKRLLPLAADLGVAVLVNRPYTRGELFRKVKGLDLPAWAEDFDCASWGQFFLKFILSHPAVTCVIPGTSKPRHMRDNLGAGRGRLPEAKERERMAAFMNDL